MQEDYERQLTFSEEAKEQAVSETTEYYEGQKAELEARLKQVSLLQLNFFLSWILIFRLKRKRSICSGSIRRRSDRSKKTPIRKYSTLRTNTSDDFATRSKRT